MRFHTAAILTIVSIAFFSIAPSCSAAHTGILEEVIVSASRSEQPISEVTTNISIVRDDELDLIGHTHINEAMHRVSGAWISRGNGQEHLTALRSPVLTGAGACGAFLMMEDGIPLRASGFCNVNELFYANSEQARQIEVIKGPASVVYGSNAMHGLINVITPRVDSTRALSLEIGPHDYRRAKTSFGTDRWRLDANGTTDGGYKDDSGFDQQKLTAKRIDNVAGWNVTSSLTVTNLNQETAGFIVGDDVYKSSESVRKANPNPEAYRDTHSLRLYSRWQRGRIVATPYFRYSHMDFIQHYLPGQALEENGHRSLGVQTAWYGDNLTAGVDAELTAGFLKETQPGATAGSPFLAETIPAGDHYDYEVDARTLAAFANYRFDLSETTELSAGLRAENVHYDYDNKMLSGRTRDDGTACGFGGCRFNRPSDRSDSFTNISPKLGLTHVRGAVQLYAFLSRGFRAPQTTELYRLQNGQNVSDIDSEKLDSLEVGLRGGDSMFNYDVSAYIMRKDNFIFRDTNRANVDNGETSHRGLEVAWSWALTESLTAGLHWSYALHRYENTPALSSNNIEGNEIDTAPRHLGSVVLAWAPHERLDGELEWVHMGEYFQDAENTQRYPGHDLLNLRLRASISDGLTGFLRITNLTDTKYAERADFAFGSDRYFVGEPRSVYAGIRVGF